MTSVAVPLVAFMKFALIERAKVRASWTARLSREAVALPPVPSER